MKFETNAFRYVVIGSTILTVPLNLFTIYVIIAKSPKNLELYKYVLLNISFWVFMSDMAIDIFLLPMPPPTKIVALYPTGLGSFFGPVGGGLCGAVTLFCVSECLAALSIAFFYRYLALNNDFRVCGWKPEREHYRYAIAVMVIVAPGLVLASTSYGFLPREEFTRMILDENPEIADLRNTVLVGPAKEGFIFACVVFFVCGQFSTIFLVLCVIAIVKRLKVLRPSMSAVTYVQHIQLMKSLAVQVSYETS
ncbi:hypothetical protein QR680_016250 [Steinernema hermaphroditum]|uniref:G protein-coupled receptor n=1 Tax=Steinernema hermaphroditum TaxID=289476 RepID=A0AA39LM12_9BILA|nr:hypothetical protein QR680_016250 [Steinernema hermaphroditum]